MTVPSRAGGQGPTSGLTVAPAAPGRLGEAAPAAALRDYLDALGGWVGERKVELDRLDEASLRATDPDSYTGDVSLSMALWQSVADRHAALVRAWDAGRADAVTREGMSRTVWGRADAASSFGGGLGMNLVEAARLSDVLAAQLRSRLSFDPRASQDAVRVAALRAALERLRELTAVEPSWAAQVDTLAARTDDAATRAARGGDVSGVLAGLESDAARAERDLIVATASAQRSRRAGERAAADLVTDRVRVQAEANALEHREDAARELAARCRRLVARPPRFAVPDVAALGPVPADRAGLDAFTARLADVARAMDVVEHAYGAPVAEREELRGLLDAYRAMAGRRPVADALRESLDAALSTARRALDAVPCDMDAARRAVHDYQRHARAAGTPPAGAAGPTGPAAGARR